MTITETASSAARAEINDATQGKEARLWGQHVQLVITTATAAQAQRIAQLEKERDDALASLPSSTNRTREQARQLLGEVLRHTTDEKLKSSHGCVEVTNAQRVIDTLIGYANALREQVADLQSRVTGAEQRAEDRQEQLTGLRRKAAESEQTCNIYREELEPAHKERDEAIKSLKKVRGEYSEMRKNRDDLEICAGEYEKNRDALRAELASARRQAQTARSEAAEDAADLDWLARHVVVVRLLLVHGARVMFCATPEDDDGYMGPSDLRSKIRAARHAAGTTEKAK